MQTVQVSFLICEYLNEAEDVVHSTPYEARWVGLNSLQSLPVISDKSSHTLPTPYMMIHPGPTKQTVNSYGKVGEGAF